MRVCRLRARSRGAMLQLQDNPSSGPSLVIRHFPEPLAVATPPTDLQQDLGLRVHIENALAAVGLGKKGRVGVLSHQGCEAKNSGDVLRVSSLLEWINTRLLPQGNVVGALALSLRSPDSGMPLLGDDKVQ